MSRRAPNFPGAVTTSGLARNLVKVHAKVAEWQTR